jgi:hypothetical protein
MRPVAVAAVLFASFQLSFLFAYGQDGGPLPTNKGGSAAPRKVYGPHPPPPQPPPNIPPVQLAPDLLLPPSRIGQPDYSKPPKQVVPPKEGFRISDRVIFVIDTSGSMSDGQRVSEAIRGALMILGSATDDFQAALVGFSDVARRWEGDPQPCTHEASEDHDRRCVLPGWASLPWSLQEALKWLNSIEADGVTNADRGIHEAMSDKTPGLTLVLITDGAIDVEGALKAIKIGRLVRKQKQLGDTAVMIWGVGRFAEKASTLNEIAKIAGGGFYVHEHFTSDSDSEEGPEPY